MASALAEAQNQTCSGLLNLVLFDLLLRKIKHNPQRLGTYSDVLPSLAHPLCTIAVCAVKTKQANRETAAFCELWCEGFVAI